MSEAVVIKALSKVYGRNGGAGRNRRGRSGQVRAVDAISLAVHSGEVYGFLGPNGAGKTTTLRMLLGLIRPSVGTLSVLGESPGSASALSRVGALIEGPAFYPYLSGRDNLLVLARYGHLPPASVDSGARPGVAERPCRRPVRDVLAWA